MGAVLNSVLTVLAVLCFAGIVYWAYSGRRKSAFDAAANAPFAVPDETLRRRAAVDRFGSGASQ